MTELQPSPPGYRVQDEAPGPPSCPPGSYKYTSHGHGSEAANFKSATYSQESYGLKQSPPRSVAPNEYYRRRSDGRRSSTENDHEGGNGKKAAAVTGYNDGHKKNTPGYKNECGYVRLRARFFSRRSLTQRSFPASFSALSISALLMRIIASEDYPAM